MRLNWVNNILNPVWVITLPLFGSIGYIATRFLDTSLIFWQFLLIFCLLAVLGTILYFRLHFISENSQKRSWLTIGLMLLPLLIFATGFYAVWTSPNLQISYNGDLHISYAIQILNGTGQPENPVMVGYPANYYWLYHALVATLGSLFNIPLATASILINTVALFATLGWAFSSLNLLIERPLSPFIMILLTIFAVFGHNLLGFILTLELVGKVSIFENLAPQALHGINIVATILYKFYNFTAFSSAIMYQWVSIFGILSILKRGWSNKAFFIIIIGIAGMVMFQIIGTIFFMCFSLFAAVILADILVTALENQSKLITGFVGHYRGLLKIILAEIRKREAQWFLAIGCFILIAMAFYTLDFLSNFNGRSAIIRLVSLFSALRIFGVFYPLLPFAFFGFIIGILRKDRLLISLTIAAALGMILFYFINVEGLSYKFLLLTNPFLTLTAILVADSFTFQMDGDDKTRIISCVLPFAIVAFTCTAINTLLLNGSYQYNAQQSHNFVYEDKYVDMPDATYNEAWIWIRENSSIDSIIVMPYKVTRYAALVTERLSYVMEFYDQLEDNTAEYEQRIEVTQVLMDSQEVSESDYQDSLAYIRSTLGNRPIILIIPTSASLSKETANNLGLEWLYSTENANIYQMPQEK